MEASLARLNLDRFEDIHEKNEYLSNQIDLNTRKIGAYLSVSSEFVFPAIDCIDAVVNKGLTGMITSIDRGDKVLIPKDDEFAPFLKDLHNKIKEASQDYLLEERVTQAGVSELMNLFGAIRFNYKYLFLGKKAGVTEAPIVINNKLQEFRKEADLLLKDLDNEIKSLVLADLDAAYDENEFIENNRQFMDQMHKVQKLKRWSNDNGIALDTAYKTAGLLAETIEDFKQQSQAMVTINKGLGRKFAAQYLKKYNLLGNGNTAYVSDSALFDASVRHCNRSGKFSTYLPRRILHIVTELHEATTNVFKLPNTAKKRSSALEKFDIEFMEQHGRKPTTEEQQAQFPSMRRKSLKQANEKVYLVPLTSSDTTNEAYNHKIDQEITDTILSGKSNDTLTSIISEQSGNRLNYAVESLFETLSEEDRTFLKMDKIDGITRSVIIKELGMSIYEFKATRHRLENLGRRHMASLNITSEDLQFFN